MEVVVDYLKEISGHSCRRLNKSTKYLIGAGNPTGIRRECLRNRNMHMGICLCKTTGGKKMERDVRRLRLFEVSAVTKLNKTFSDL